MDQSALGEGLIFEDFLPLVFIPGSLARNQELAHINAENHQILATESSFDEVRVHEALKDESPALVHELQRLEYKINILLRLTADLSMRHSALPKSQSVRLSAHALQWLGEEAPAAGATGLLELYINPALPQALKVPTIIEGAEGQGAARVALLRFTGLSESVVELLEKLIFRRHRRLIAGTRLAAH